MSTTITSYATLQAAIADWLARSDLTARIPDFIAFFEATANRRLRLRKMLGTVALEFDSNGAADLPDDFLTWQGVRWTGTPSIFLDYVDRAELYSRYPDNATGIPRLFALTSSEIVIRPIDATTAITLRYYAKLQSLTEGVTTNWLLEEHPDIYLAGALTEAYTIIQDLDKAAMWQAKRDLVFAELGSLDQKTRGPSQIRPYDTPIW